ncbi:ParA family protein [Spirosoma agri]|uniref:ParA family protein n=1 Tax=Spirosoma agri TaxID=1987381 RepID=A0A6M0IRW3_9BACT|nr:ParA family protein [Spirosoma agri]NEU70824.1 ParA family protein [Spirosoma agri]
MSKPIVIAIFNNKGGTGKTTITFNLAAGLANRGYSVLMADLDPQANLTLAVGIPAQHRHVGQLLTGDATWEEVVEVSQKKDSQFSVLPSSLDLIRSEAILSTDAEFFALRNLLEEEYEKDPNKFYDFVLIDCPPSLGIMTRNALCAAHYYIVPLQGENFAFHGLAQIIKQAGRIKKDFNQSLELAGILKNRFGERTKYGAEIQKALEESKLPVFNTSIRQSISLMESAADHKSIFEYDSTSNGAKDFEQLIDELLPRVTAK